MTFGKNLQAARLQANLTQDQVAEKLFVTRQTVSRWETERTLPNVYFLKDLSTLYGVSVDSLLQGLENPQKGRLTFMKINQLYLRNLMKINPFWHR